MICWSLFWLCPMNEEKRKLISLDDFLLRAILMICLQWSWKKDLCYGINLVFRSIGKLVYLLSIYVNSIVFILILFVFCGSKKESFYPFYATMPGFVYGDQYINYKKWFYDLYDKNGLLDDSVRLIFFFILFYTL